MAKSGLKPSVSWIIPVIALLLHVGCSKVGFQRLQIDMHDTHAFWYEGEETLYVFYNFAEGDIRSQNPVIEIRVENPGSAIWQDVSRLVSVHQHANPQCLPQHRCGSVSIAVKPEAFTGAVKLRYRFDANGELSDEIELDAIRIPDDGTPKSRSAHVYGVFDETNRHVQWRIYNVFPSLSHPRALALGLRRRFSVKDFRYGQFDLKAQVESPRLYGVLPHCDQISDTSTSWPVTGIEEAVHTAKWQADALPDGAATAEAVCGLAEVAIANNKTAQFTAIARRNPRVSPAYGSLKVDLRPTRHLSVVVRPCFGSLDAEFLAFQNSRLLITEPPDLLLCSDQADSYKAEVIYGSLNALVEQAKLESDSDLFFKITMHHLQGVQAEAERTPLNAAIAMLAAGNLANPSPRFVGAFIYDSGPVPVNEGPMSHVALWCPRLLLPEVTDTNPSVSACRFLPTTTSNLGPLRLAALPVLPSLDGYRRFRAERPEADQGQVKALQAYTPRHYPDSYSVRLEDPQVATFFNGEVLSLSSVDALSYCHLEDQGAPLAYRPLLDADLPDPSLPSDSTDPDRARSLVNLPGYHNSGATERSYHLGVAWDFPFLMMLEYKVAVEAGVSVVAGTIPFGLTSGGTEVYGTDRWFQPEWDVGSVLTRCSQFCDHPAFNTQGAYNAGQTWRREYETACYRPVFPTPIPGASSNPYDP